MVTMEKDEKLLFSVNGTYATRHLSESLKLDFFESKLVINKYKETIMHGAKNSFAGSASYSEFTEFRYSDPYTAFYGAPVGGVMSVNMPGNIEMKVANMHRMFIWGQDNEGMSEREFKEMYDCIAEKIKTEGGRM